MTRLLAFLILACVGIGGCAGPAEAQPDSIEADRLKRVEDAMVGHGERIDELGDKITDDRFDTVNAQMVKMESAHEKSTDDLKDAFATSLDALTEELKAISAKLQILTIIISTVAGGGVLGGGAVYQLTKPSKKGDGVSDE